MVMHDKLDGRYLSSVVFESFNGINKRILSNHIKKSAQVYLVESFVAYHNYHKESNIRGFPLAFPAYVESALEKGTLKLISAESIEGKTIYSQAADKAVDVIESVFPEYREDHTDLFNYVSCTLKSDVAENIFKKNLCNRLAKFYSLNIMLHRIEKKLAQCPVLVYPDSNVRSYLYLRDLLVRSNQEVFEHPDTFFPRRVHVASFLENLKKNLSNLIRLSAQTIGGGLFSGFNTFKRKKRRSYLYGVTIVSPSRQLRGNERDPGFIIDNKTIKAEEVVCFPLNDLSSDYKNKLAKMPWDVCFLPKVGRFFSHFKEWKKLLCLALKNNFLHNGEEINEASIAFFNYFRWLNVMQTIRVRHFITQSDFAADHISRNIALNQAGVQTWYFLISMNFGCNWRDKNGKNSMRHPYWTYLNYDYFVTWNNFLDQYFKSHPGTSKRSHIVGCLWSGHIKGQNRVKEEMVRLNLIKRGKVFIIVAFDTTYSRNGVISYSEGMVFAEHLLKLVDDYTDIKIFLKEKKERNLHGMLDPVNGPKLVSAYNEINCHPRISAISDKVDRIAGSKQETNETSNMDSSELISAADMIVSLPFTSTTFEALSANKPAIWHDPMGYYKNTVYGNLDSVTTHGYEELKAKVLEIKNMKPGRYKNPIPMKSPLMDPYRDGKAIDRFRDLLVSS